MEIVIKCIKQWNRINSVLKFQTKNIKSDIKISNVAFVGRKNLLFWNYEIINYSILKSKFD